MGTIYQRGPIFWIKYYRTGKTFRESSRSRKEGDAVRLLRLREGQIVQGTFSGLQIERVTFDELAKDFTNDYRVNSRKSLRSAELFVRRLTEYFAGVRAADITTPRVHSYIVTRQEEGLSNGTINRHLSALKRMLNLGARQTPPKVLRVPYIPHLKENNTRSGFFLHDEFLSLRGALPDFLKPVITIAYYTGLRRGEILALTWDCVDLSSRRIFLAPGTTKNDESRIIYMTDDLHKVLSAWKRFRDWIVPHYPLVCFRFKGTKPLPVREFRGEWADACKIVGLEGRRLHDFRRTAVRNMVRAGIPELVAMRISGHKTRSVFDRYNITNEADLADAASKLGTYLAAHGHNLGTMDDFEAFCTPSETSEVIDNSWSRRSGLNRRPADYELQQIINKLQMMRRINGQISAERDIQDANTQLSATRSRAALAGQ